MINSIAFDIFNKFKIEIMVETGVWQQHSLNFVKTWNGILKPKVQYYGIEQDNNWAKKAIQDNQNDPKITIIHNDSRKGLIDLINSKILINKNIFFYLDAHWFPDWPLYEEIKILISNLKKFIIGIDDFYTPAHSNYGYDNP